MLDTPLKYQSIHRKYLDLELEGFEAMRFLNLKQNFTKQVPQSCLGKPNKVNSFNEKSIMVPRSPYRVQNFTLLDD